MGEKIFTENGSELNNQIRETRENFHEIIDEIKENTVTDNGEQILKLDIESDNGRNSDTNDSKSIESISALSGKIVNDTEDRKNINVNSKNTNMLDAEIYAKEVNVSKDTTLNLTSQIENSSEKSNKINPVKSETIDLHIKKATVKSNKTCSTESVRKISDNYTQKKTTKKMKIELTNVKQSKKRPTSNE